MVNTMYHASQGSGELLASSHLGERLGTSLAGPNVLADLLPRLEIADICGSGFSWGQSFASVYTVLFRVASSKRECLKESQA